MPWNGTPLKRFCQTKAVVFWHLFSVIFVHVVINVSTVCPSPCNPVYTLCSYENGTTHQVFDLQPPEMASFSVWQRGQLVPEMMPGEGEDSFQIILEGRTQGDHPGAIALDDLIFHPDCR